MIASHVNSTVPNSAYFNPPGGSDRIYFHIENVGDRLTRGEGVWIGANGGHLPCPIRIRLGRGREGFVITGLVIGELGDQAITSETLRKIRLSEVLHWLFASWGDGTPPPYPFDGTYHSSDELQAAQDQWLMHHMFKSLVIEAAGETTEGDAERQELVRFAEVYTRNLASQRHRAVTATAQQLNVSRATANRRITRARQLGILPTPGVNDED